MLRILQKGLIAPALLVASLGANAQIVTENFQGWEEANLKITAPATTANETDQTCDPVTIEGSTNSPGHGLVNSPIPLLELTKVYPGGSVQYTIVNGGVVPNCQAKGAYATSTSPLATIAAGVTKGYVEINKTPTGTAATEVGGSFITSKFAHVESLKFSVSGTSSGRITRLFTSTDDGVTWVKFGPDYQAGKGGNVYTAAIMMDEVQLRIQSYDQIIRIHDFVVFDQALSINDAWLSTGAKVVVENNKVMVSSPTSGSLEVVDTKGQVALQSVVAAGLETSFILPESGLYIVRLVTNGKMATKKIMVQ